MDFEQREDLDGIRLTWNALPRLRMQHQRNVVPLTALYTPMIRNGPINTAPKEAIITCRQCLAFALPFCQGMEGGWYCAFCGFQNRLALTDLSAFQHSTIEYKTGRQYVPPVFLFVVDSAFLISSSSSSSSTEAEPGTGQTSSSDSKTFSALVDSIEDQISQLPEDSRVGFISYGENVLIHETGAQSQSQRTWAFNGKKSYSLEEVLAHLGLIDPSLKSSNMPRSNSARAFETLFFAPIAQFEYNIGDIVRSLSSNLFPAQGSHEREGRCTGSALNVAQLLLKAVFGEATNLAGNVLTYVGGPCTHGPGMIVGKLLTEALRSHHDIEKANAQLLKVGDKSHVRQARQYYRKIGDLFAKLGMACLLLVGSYDQVGLFEMEPLCNKTGGDMIMCDLFDTTMFRQSNNMLPGQLSCYNGTLEVRCTSGLTILGMIGNGLKIAIKSQNKFISDLISPLQKHVGAEAGTNSWKCCNVGPTLTFAVYFDRNDVSLAGQFSFLQFIFFYQSTEGTVNLRVTTVPINVVADNEMQQLEYGFDQEAALVTIARELVYRLQTQEARDPDAPKVANEDIGKLLDKKLIDYCLRFAVFNKRQLDSFRLLLHYLMLPQFLYHLRRSPLIRVFNNSPDETSYVRHAFLKEELTSSLTMVQPTLLSYDIDNFLGEPEPVLLDLELIGPNKILLLDTFFQVLIFHGKTVAEWRKAKYHEQAEYEYFKEFLEAPKTEAMQILVDRFPLPRFIDCDEGGSQARFLMAKLNPLVLYSLPAIGGVTVLTDDVSLQLFMDHVQRLVVNV